MMMLYDVYLFLSAFQPLVHVGSYGEEGIAAGVEGGLNRVLHHTDDESYRHYLHGYIVADAEE